MCILIRNVSDKAILGAKIGLKAGSSDIMKARNIPANPGRYDCVARGVVGILLHETEATSLYFSATDFNNATVIITLFTRQISVPR